MKKINLFLFALIVMNVKAQCPWTFTVFNYAPSYSITCANNTLNLTAQSNTNGVTYVWTGPSFTQSAATASITNAGNYTLTATAANSCVLSQTFAIGVNTTAPTNTVNPVSQVVSCNGAPATFTGTALSPSTNIQNNWYSPLNPLPNGQAIATSNTTLSILAANLSPGVYTFQTVNTLTGCKANKTVTVTSLSAFPTFSMMSPTNYSVGCAPLNQTTLCIINPVSQQTPAATCSYTFLAPTFTGVLTQSIILGNNTCTTTTLPGNWTVVVQDNSNFCRTELVVPIWQNTATPNLAASMVTQTLTCKQPTIYAIGTSTDSNVDIDWTYPGQVPQPTFYTIAIGPPNGPPTSTVSTSYGVYTVIATNTVNGCSTTSLVTINQNFKPPISAPLISIAGPTASCNNTVVLTTGNSTTTSGGGPSAFITNPCWAGPPPQTPTCGPSTYSALVPGIYTLTVTDNYNGCTASGTVNVPSAGPAFTMQAYPATSSVACNASVVVTTQQPSGYTITCTSGTVSGNMVTNLCYGTHTICVTNTVCTTCQTVVISGATSLKNQLTEDDILIYPNPSEAKVNFKNKGEVSGTISVFNAEGKLVKGNVIEGNSEIEISELSPGIYFVELKTDQFTGRKKLIVLQN